jgi:cysteinyl-tRNA synthetase
MIRVYNTITRQKEEFQTLEPGLVKMYVCGVTVYSDAHVGHAMSALVFDVIRRYLEYRGYKVRHVMNYTDVDDKIIARAQKLGDDPSTILDVDQLLRQATAQLGAKQWNFNTMKSISPYHKEG